MKPLSLMKTTLWLLASLLPFQKMELTRNIFSTFQQSEADKNSRRSSIQDELAQQQQQQQPQIRIPSPSSGEVSDAFYFAPISPAAKTTTAQQQQQQEQQQQQQQQLNPLMELLRGNASGKHSYFELWDNQVRKYMCLLSLSTMIVCNSHNPQSICIKV